MWKLLGGEAACGWMAPAHDFQVSTNCSEISECESEETRFLVPENAVLNTWLDHFLAEWFRATEFNPLNLNLLICRLK